MRQFKTNVLLLLLFAMLACNEKKQPTETVEDISKESKTEETTIFPRGQKGPAEIFTGNAYNYGLVANDSIYNTLVGNVFFVPGARSNWHLHPGGQILVVTSGVGYHQLKGEEIEIIRKGDVVKCPPNIDHWHGASKDSSMTHIYILPNTEKGIVEWKAPVTDEEYKNVTKK